MIQSNPDGNITKDLYFKIFVYYIVNFLFVIYAFIFLFIMLQKDSVSNYFVKLIPFIFILFVISFMYKNTKKYYSI